MTATVIRIGNSNGLVIPAKYLKSLSISERDNLDISIQNGGLFLKKSRGTESRTPFSDLDEWNQANGYDGSVTDALDYVKSVREARTNKGIKEW